SCIRGAIYDVIIDLRQIFLLIANGLLLPFIVLMLPSLIHPYTHTLINYYTSLKDLPTASRPWRTTQQFFIRCLNFITQSVPGV
ncbi:hypothetical protein M1M98_03770, partial [Thermodesulfovibrionales bacterium]|nr:hypothetical protein [Thermodesulfovibrionales bacterium]